MSLMGFATISVGGQLDSDHRLVEVLADLHGARFRASESAPDSEGMRDISLEVDCATLDEVRGVVAALAQVGLDA